MNFINKVQYACERFVVWSLRTIIVKHSSALAGHFQRVQAEAAKFQSEAIYVFQNHWAHLNAMNARLEAIERKGDQ